VYTGVSLVEVVVIEGVEAAGVELFLVDPCPLGAVAFAEAEPEWVEAFGAGALAGFGAFVLDLGAWVFVTVGFDGLLVGWMANTGPAFATSAKATIESHTVVRRMETSPRK
jgi:hypothetical protein